jgi:HD-like signal output (HDOD) protein
MQQLNVTGLEGWVDFLTKADIPVLKQTARDLAELYQDQGKLSARNVAGVITVDPMMTVKLLRFLQQNKRRSQTSEVALVEQALIMLGVEAFYNKLPPKPLVQDAMAGHTDALIHLLHVLHRAHRASEYAYDWAVRLSDLHYEEVRIAALLHDFVEMLMWCFVPEKMMKIRAMMRQDSTLRSRTAQEEIFGFALSDLQKLLVKNWELPELLLMLMDDENAEKPRVLNVTLAVNFSRHSAHGWDNAALPDDFTAIAKLLRMSPEQVTVMLGVKEGAVCDINKPRH